MPGSIIPTIRGRGRTSWPPRRSSRQRSATSALGVNLFAGAASEGIDRLWEAHLLANFRLPVPPAPEASGGVGLANTRARLKSLYGAEHRFEIAALPGEGTVVHIELPFQG